MISSISFQSPSSSTRDLCRFQKFGQVTTDKSRRSDRRSRYKISPIASCRRELIRRHLPNVHTPTDKDKEVLCLPIESRRISSSTMPLASLVELDIRRDSIGRHSTSLSLSVGVCTLGRCRLMSSRRHEAIGEILYLDLRSERRDLSVVT